MENELVDEIFKYTLLGTVGGMASMQAYLITLAKGVWDTSYGKNTFFSRAIIPIINHVWKEDNITNESEWQEILRIKKEERERRSQLESSVKGGEQ